MKKPAFKESIICPYCGREYVPSEIFYPEDLLPNVGDVVRKENGLVEFCTGSQELESEEYCCDGCGKTFKVTPALSFLVEKVEVEDFDEDFSTQIYKDRISLEEPKE